MKGHGNCCRFATLTGVHQGAQISLPCEILDQWKIPELEQSDYRNNSEVEVVPVVDLNAYKKHFVGTATQVIVACV